MVATLLPSAEQVFIAWAKTYPALAAIHGGRVGTKLGSLLPAIRVTRIGDAPPEPWEDDANLQLEFWAADQGAADLLVRTLVASMPDIRNLPVTGGKVCAYGITAGPYWSPDDPNLSSNARYIVSVSLLITT